MQQKTSIVHAAGVTKFGVGHSGVTVIFDEMTVTLPTDRICAILGRSSSEGTTFLQLLSGFKRPDSGSILTDVKFSIIGNSGTFFHTRLTGLENLKILARMYGMDSALLTRITLGLSKFGSDWQFLTGALPGPRRRAMEMLVAALLPFDCYLMDDADRADPDTFIQVLQILRTRDAGMIFTARSPKFVRKFATFGSVMANQTIYACASIDEALQTYAQ